MQLNQLKFLVAVDQYGSISRAAQELYISQSTVSLALINLEEEMGVSILSRSKRGISFTEEGKLILERARIIVSEIEQLTSIQFDGEALSGEVRVGGSSHFCMNIITDMVIQMKRLHPAVRISTKRQYVKDIVKSVAQKELDLGFINFTTLNEAAIRTELQRYQLEFLPVFQDKQHICASSHHPLTGKQNLSFSELLPYDLVSLNFRMDEFTYNFFRQRGYQKDPVSINDVSNLRKYADSLDAMIVMPGKEIESSNRTYQNQFYALDVPEFDVTMTTGFLYHSASCLTQKEQKVLELLERECQRYQDMNS